jgi:hypothetical protein
MEELEEINDLNFSALLCDLPFYASNEISSNLSVHSAFVCLLHLANEHKLKFTKFPSEDTDFNIFIEVNT